MLCPLITAIFYNIFTLSKQSHNQYHSFHQYLSIYAIISNIYTNIQAFTQSTVMSPCSLSINNQFHWQVWYMETHTKSPNTKDGLSITWLVHITSHSWIITEMVLQGTWLQSSYFMRTRCSLLSSRVLEVVLNLDFGGLHASIHMQQ